MRSFVVLPISMNCDNVFWITSQNIAPPATQSAPQMLKK